VTVFHQKREQSGYSMKNVCPNAFDTSQRAKIPAKPILAV